MKVKLFHTAAAGAFAIGSFLIASNATAQVNSAANPTTPTLQLTLENAVRRAVENNPELSIVRLGTAVEAARVGEARTAFTPMFSTTLGRSSSVTPPSN